MKQGKFNGTTFLQTIDYAYKSNGLLSGITQYLGTATTGDLFYEELFYDNNLSGSTAVSKKNGEISNIKWQRRNSTIVGGVHAYTYNEFGELLTNDYYNLTGATTFTSTPNFDETFTYSGKYGKITGHTKKNNTGATFDSLIYNYITNSPRVANVNDPSDNATGHNQNGQATSGNIYQYDLNGNQKNDPYRGVDSIKYNFLDLPDTIFLSGSKRVVISYDAVGNMLHKKVYNTGLALVENRTYTSGFEFVAYGTGTQSLEMVHHSQGYYRISTSKHEYTIADHLGNTRIVYTDANGNGVVDQAEILDENHYYAYGMEMSDPAFLNNSIYKYKFNGIERTESLGLMMDLALYRGLDPVLGKWYQVDPKAEQGGYHVSPYCAMGNNPVVHTDPKGDILPAALLGAAIGVVSNGIGNLVSGNNFFAGAGKAALFGAIGGAISFGIGSAANSLFGSGASVGKAVFQMGAHSLSGGAMSAAQGGSFTSGLLSGGLSSSMSSVASAAGISGWGMVGIGGLAGGVGSSLAGGDFWKGVGQGLITSGLNHAAHTGVFGEGLAMSLLTGRVRHIFGPDAISATGSFFMGAGIGGTRDKGGLLILRGKDAGLYPIDDTGVGLSTPQIGVSIQGTSLYYSGAEVLASYFYGHRYDISVGGNFLGSLSVGAVFANNVDNIGGFVIGKTISVGAGISALGFNVMVTTGTTGRTNREAINMWESRNRSKNK